MQTPEIPSPQQQKLEEELFQRASRVKPADADGALERLPSKIAEVVDSVNQKAPAVKRMLQNVRLLYEMLRDDNFTIAWSSKAIVIAGLLYFISPIDLLPDYIPLLGYIDDAFVISAVLNSVAAEIERYRTLKNP